MENLRWILIFAGVAILALLYLSGRQSSGSRRQGDALNRNRQRDPGNQADPLADPLMGDDSFAEPIDGYGVDDYGVDGYGDDVELEDPLERPGGQRASGQRTSRRRAVASPEQSGLASISSKIEAFGNKLSPRRRARIEAADKSKARPASETAYDSKIVTLHVVAPEGQLMNGGLLLDQFEQRGYHYGDMNIFHSMHDGKTVFSIAKLVVPGTFDINDMDSFQTPGISLILQLPGPVAADVAFEVLLSESHEIADALGATVLDADRSTLSKQTVQHMREGIHEYMHKQKYFSEVSS